LLRHGTARQAQGTSYEEAEQGVAALVAACTGLGLSGLYYTAGHDAANRILAIGPCWVAGLSSPCVAAQGRLEQLVWRSGLAGAVAIIGLCRLMYRVNWTLPSCSIPIV